MLAPLSARPAAASPTGAPEAHTPGLFPGASAGRRLRPHASRPPRCTLRLITFLCIEPRGPFPKRTVQTVRIHHLSVGSGRSFVCSGPQGCAAALRVQRAARPSPRALAASCGHHAHPACTKQLASSCGCCGCPLSPWRGSRPPWAACPWRGSRCFPHRNGASLVLVLGKRGPCAPPLLQAAAMHACISMRVRLGPRTTRSPHPGVAVGAPAAIHPALQLGSLSSPANARHTSRRTRHTSLAQTGRRLPAAPHARTHAHTPHVQLCMGNACCNLQPCAPPRAPGRHPARGPRNPSLLTNAVVSLAFWCPY